MNDLWFDPNRWAWLPGTLYGCLCGAFGALAGCLAPKGKARGLVIGLGWLMLAAAVVLLGIGLYALQVGQPFAIWFFLLLPGAQGLLILGPLFPLIYIRYRQAEERRMVAKDLEA